MPADAGGRQRRRAGQCLAAGTGLDDRAGQFLDEHWHAVGALDDLRRKRVQQLAIASDALDHHRADAPVELVQGLRRDLRQPAPGLLEFRTEGQD